MCVCGCGGACVEGGVCMCVCGLIEGYSSG